MVGDLFQYLKGDAMNTHDEALKALIAPLRIHANEEELSEIACTLRKLSDAAEVSRQYHELAKAIVYIVRMSSEYSDTLWDIRFFLDTILYGRDHLREQYAMCMQRQLK